jgi:hypothetical protein
MPFKKAGNIDGFAIAEGLAMWINKPFKKTGSRWIFYQWHTGVG